MTKIKNDSSKSNKCHQRFHGLWKDYDRYYHARTPTWNPLIRSQMPYPLGQKKFSLDYFISGKEVKRGQNGIAKKSKSRAISYLLSSAKLTIVGEVGVSSGSSWQFTRFAWVKVKQRADLSGVLSHSTSEFH